MPSPAMGAKFVTEGGFLAIKPTSWHRRRRDESNDTEIAAVRLEDVLQKKLPQLVDQNRCLEF